MATKVFYAWKPRVNQLKTDAYILKTRKIRYGLNTLTTERVFPAGDSDGCTLVVPEVFKMHEHITHCPLRFTSFNFEAYVQERKKQVH